MEEEVAGLPRGAPLAGAGGTAGRPSRSPADGPDPSIGAYLARQRRLRGLSLDELARTTCIPLRSLERLESGAFDATPDGFARGFVRTVAVALGLDPDDTVARMLPEARIGPRPRPQPLAAPGASWLPAALALGVVLSLVGLFWTRWSAPPPEPADLRADYVYRRDAVRELAHERGLLPAPSPAQPVVPPALEPAAPTPPETQAPSGPETGAASVPGARPPPPPAP
jgi:hypothetical protein